MREELIKFRVFNVDDRVKIIPGTRFYKGGLLESNPKDIGGKITRIQDDWHSVLWDNGRKNGYEVDDITFEGEDKTYTVNGNKIYLSKTPEDFNELLSILYPLEDGLRSQQTFYKDAETGNMIPQCSRGKMRSFDDIWIIADTYFPDIPVEEVFAKLMLWNVRPGDITRGVLPKQLSNCSTMQRIRYTNGLMSFKQIWANIDCAHFKSIYRWRDLFNLIHINSEQQLRDWYINELKKLQNGIIC